MKKWIIALLIIGLIAGGCGGGVGKNADQDTPSPLSASVTSGSWLNLVVWDRVTYEATKEKVTNEQLGQKLGEVKQKIEGSGKEPNYQLQDGDATLLPEGTEIYTIKETDSKVKIAVKADGNYTVYEARTP